MERNNNGTHSACAACKHQRKKCSEGCILAPYFPGNKTREFQAVHKLFGVSNMTKMVKNAKEEDRRGVVDSMTWEACCWQRDPMHGPYGEYAKLYNLYNKIYNKFNNFRSSINQPQIQVVSSQGYNPQQAQIVDGRFDYFQNNNNGIVDNTYYFQELNGTTSYERVDGFQQHPQPYYITGDQFNNNNMMQDNVRERM